jgi:hypothetical protein
VLLAFGWCESLDVEGQSWFLAAAVRASGKKVDLIAGAGYNLFELL